jgi:hypothetical protein
VLFYFRAWNQMLELHFSVSSVQAIAATIAYCKYLRERYGRFPVHGGPFSNAASFQFKPLFSANYRWAMARGEAVLQAELAGRRTEEETTELNESSKRSGDNLSGLCDDS